MELIMTISKIFKKIMMLSVMVTMVLGIGLVAYADYREYNMDEYEGEWYPAGDGELYFKDIINTVSGYTSDMTNVTIPESFDGVTVEKIMGFNEAENLLRVEIPDTVTEIGYYTFFQCSNLMEIIIPNTVTYIDYAAFYGCSSLTTIDLPDYIEFISGALFYECSSLQEITIPNGVTIINEDAFYGCTSLKEVIIPSGVTTIWSCAFGDCTSLETVYLPHSLENLTSDVFIRCDNLTDIYYYGTKEEWSYIDTDMANISDSITVHCMGSDMSQYPQEESITSQSTESDNVSISIRVEEKEFTLGVDSNYFTHSSSSANSGFYGLTSYYLTASDRAKLFAEATSTGDYASLTDAMYSDWWGSCFGIANVMGAVYNNTLSISDISSSSVSSFYNLTSPTSDDVLMSSINYYHLQQYISDTDLCYMYSSGLTGLDFWSQINTATDSAVFFQTAMEYLDQGQSLVMIMYSESHAILMVDYEYDAANNNYIFTLYDENTVSSPGNYGEFYYWTVSENLEEFTISENCKYDINSKDNYGIALSIPGSRAAGTVGDTITFVLDTKGNYIIDMGNGQCIYCVDQSIDTNVTIHGGSVIVFDSEDENTCKYIIEVDRTEEFEIIDIEGDIDIAIYSNDAYVSIAGSNIESASIILGEEVIIEGEDYEFESFVTTSELYEDGTPNVISVTGTAETTAEIDITEDNIDVSSEGNIKNLTTTSYVEGEILVVTESSNSNVLYIVIVVVILVLASSLIIIKKKK